MYEFTTQEQLKQGLSQVAQTLVMRLTREYSGVEDIFTYSPDLSAQRWFVTGKERSYNTVVSVRTREGEEFIVGIFTTLSAESGRSIALHVLKIDQEEFEGYRKFEAETPAGIFAEALFALKKEERTKLEPSGKLTSAFWLNPDVKKGDIGTQFSSPSLDSEIQSIMALKIYDDVLNNKEMTLLHHSTKEDLIVVRDTTD